MHHLNPYFSSLLVSAALFLVSCSNPSKLFDDPAHKVFSKQSDYAQTFARYENLSLKKELTPQDDEVKLIIDLDHQRALLVKGSSVIFDTPCTTGKSEKPTPVGTYKILEKIEDKRSNIFGKCYLDGEVVYKGDVRKCEVEYDTYEGFSIPYWMRLNYDGVGLHQSHSIKRYPASNGCIRIPADMIRKFYENVEVGTEVNVISGQDAPSFWFL